MARLTALVAVLTLTGSPIAGAMCVTWCERDSTVMMACHEEAEAGTQVTVSTAHRGCAVLPAPAPAVREPDRRLPSDILVLPAMPTTAAFLLPDAGPINPPAGRVPSQRLEPPITLRV